LVHRPTPAVRPVPGLCTTSDVGYRNLAALESVEGSGGQLMTVSVGSRAAGSYEGVAVQLVDGDTVGQGCELQVVVAGC